MPETISYDQLRKAEACNGQLLLFRKTFGKRVTVSHDLVLQVVELGFYLEWAASNLLTQSARESYEAAIAPAKAVFNQILAQARTGFNETLAQASAVLNEALPQAKVAFDEAMAPARAAFIETMKPANAAYDETLAQARAVFNEVMAHAFVDAYLAS